jgi:2,6-dihydroxypseudooxynicotine hydrolase
VADERVQSAIANWAPRFTANGVTVGDFRRITGPLEHWSDWCGAWSAVGAEHEGLGRTALAQGRTISAGEHLARAAVYYHFAKFVFVEDLDQMRGAHERAVTCLTDALPHLDPPGRRVEIPFEGSSLFGVLRHPRGAGPHPVVVLLSGLDSAKEELRSTEETFLARGLATLSVDGPGQGEAEYAIPIRGDWSSPGRAIVDYLSTVDGIDAHRLGVWGVSLGGYYAPRMAAALGSEITACVALAGPYDFGANWERLPALTRETFQVRSGATGDAQAHAIASTLTMAGQAENVTAPLLVVFGRKDRLIPWQQAVRLVDEVGPGGELLMLEEGNHGCANISPWHRPYTADWLAERLGTSVRTDDGRGPQ